MRALIGQTVPFVRTIAIRFAAGHTFTVYTQFTDRALIFGRTIDTAVSLLVTLARRAITVQATALQTDFVFADFTLAAIGILATTCDTSPFLAD